MRATGFGLDALRTELAAVLASLWVDIDLDLPYAAGDLLARRVGAKVRELRPEQAWSPSPHWTGTVPPTIGEGRPGSTSRRR